MKAVLGQIVNPQVVRGVDAAGSGAFGSSRKRKRNGVWQSVPAAHQGLDILTRPGQIIASPITGKIIAVGVAYSDDNRYSSIMIQGDDQCYQSIRVKLLYVQPNVVQGQTVIRGQSIGLSQNISLKYSDANNHVHIEVYFNGVVQNPVNLFGPSQCDDDRQLQASIASSNQINDEGKSDTDVVSYIYSAIDNAFVEDLIKQQQFGNVLLSKQQLLEVQHEGRTNHRRLFEGLTNSQKRKYNNGNSDYSTSADYPISQGTEIFIPVNRIKIERAYESNITVTKSKASQYFAPILRELTNDPGYIAAYNNKGVDAKDIYPQLTVWLWSRVKYLETDGKNGFIDITKDVISCNVGTTIREGGNFNINLPPIVTRYEQQSESTPNSTWNKIDSDAYSEGEFSDSVSLGHINRERLFKAQQSVGSEYIRNDFYYDRVIQQNDLVFISFEKLEIDGSDIDKSVGGKWYDMIGLVDVVTTSTVAGSTDVTITARGRDLFKVLQDDNSYFNPYSIGHANSIYGGVFGSRYLQGEFKELSAILPRSIKDSLEFVFHRIASIGYVPEDIFDQFDNKTEITKTIKGLDKNQEKSVKGIWQIIKVFIDQSIQDLRLVDDSVSNPNGSLLDIIRKIAQSPFVEFYGDTYGDKYYLTFRKPPITFDAVFEAVWNIDNVDEDFSSFKSDQQTPIGGANQNQINKYQKRESEKQEQKREQSKKIDILIDENDTSFETQNLDQAVVIASEVYPKIININEDDVLYDNLQFSNESYAWYKLTERGNFAGNTVSLGHIPSLYFDEYAQVFGNKMLDVTSNYSDYHFFEHSETANQVDLYAEQASQLLAFLVETNAYLPFTREGSITINGDRRIKKGNWIYYRPTKEVFYVIGVDNSISINEGSNDRTTTITVERGMVKSYIKNKTVQITDVNGVEKTIEASYFNIVDIDVLRDGIYDTIAKGSVADKFNYKANMGLNSDVFNFFLQKKQFQTQDYED